MGHLDSIPRVRVLWKLGGCFAQALIYALTFVQGPQRVALWAIGEKALAHGMSDGRVTALLRGGNAGSERTIGCAARPMAGGSIAETQTTQSVLESVSNAANADSAARAF